MKAKSRTYHSEWTDQLRREGLEQGRINQAHQGLVAVCAARSLGLGDAERALISECDDLAQLHEWLSRAATATSVDEIFAD